MKKDPTKKLFTQIAALSLCLFMTLGFLGCKTQTQNGVSSISTAASETEKDETNSTVPQKDEVSSKASQKEETNSKISESSKPAPVSSKEQNKPIYPKDVDISDATYQSVSSSGAITTYKNGEFPKEVNIGDVFICGDYIYKYGYRGSSNSKTWTKSEEEGWGMVLNSPRDKESYSDILYTINNKSLSISALRCLFKDCTSLKVAPAVPSGAKDICFMFEGCTSLVSVPDIPNSVTNMGCTFQGCTSLKKPPKLSNKVENVHRTFSHCTALETAPAFPNTVTEMMETFFSCTSLKNVPAIPDSVKNMTFTFYYCTALETAPKLPKNLKSLSDTFVSCYSLKTMPAIPSSVTYISSPFAWCAELTGEIEINTDAFTRFDIFAGTTKPIKIVGSCSLETKKKLAEGAQNGNVTY